jgi:hypothetical protein
MSFESLTGYDSDPEPEPEIAWMLTNINNPAYTVDAKITGGKMRWYVFPKDMNKDGKIDPMEGEPMNELNFWVAFYKKQMEVTEAKMKSQLDGKAKLEAEIKTIKERINGRAKDYSNQFKEVEDAKDLLEDLNEDYNAKLGVKFFHGDVAEEAMRRRIDAVTAKIVQLQGYKEFAYADDLMDITDPLAGIQHFPDVSVLIKKYDNLAGKYGDQADYWEKRRDHNKDAYDKWFAVWNAYYNPKPKTK